MPFSGSTSGSLRMRSSIGSRPHGGRELVDRGLEREHPGALAGRAHPRRGRDVERDEPVAGQAVGRRVHHARGRAGLLGELAHGRGLLERVVGDRGERAVLGGAEADALDRRRAVADAGEHLLAPERALDGSVDHAGRDRGEHRLRPRRALGAEAAADVLGDHAHALGVELEHLGERAARAVGALDRVVEQEVAVLPDREAGVRLHRVVVDGGGGVGLVDLDLCACERLLRLALRGVGGERRVDLVRLVEARVRRRRARRRGRAARSRCGPRRRPRAPARASRPPRRRRSARGSGRCRTGRAAARRRRSRRGGARCRAR